MSNDSAYEKLVALLRELGVRTIDDRATDGQSGFPLSVPLADGGSLILDLPNPAILTSLDPEWIGVAILDPLGYVRASWGLAKRVPFFRKGLSVLESEIGALLESCSQGGRGALYLDGYRYFSAGLSGGEVSDVFVLVVNANDERQARRQATRSGRMATALKRLGGALTMNQQMQPMCVAAAHEIASSAELAAVLIWTFDQDDNTLKLVSSVGANRQASGVLGRLAGSGGSSCVAELVATSRQPFFLKDVLDHMMTANLEAKFCYLKPGGLSVHPLVISDRLLGVLELVGREGDTHFDEQQELFQTIAEHLALALNSASMFENFERWATHDALTGIANHRHLQEFLHHRISEAERTGQDVGVVMLDVDHFRSFNEEEGHDAGDDVLKLVTEAMKSCLRPYDLPARYGGEEFTIIMPGSSRETTLKVAERIRAKVESTPYITRSGRERHVTVSIGCAGYPSTAKDAGSALKAADTALYEAKRAGRNKVNYFEGAFVAAAKPAGPDLERVVAWIDPDQREASEALFQSVRWHIEQMSELLNLSSTQADILRMLVRIVGTYKKLREDNDRTALEAMESAEEFRLLLPSLYAFEERFDGKGPQQIGGARIPLLARVLAVVLALAEDGGQSLLDDPGRFDPEIVSIVAELKDAA